MNSINDNKVGKISLEGEDKNKLVNLLIKYKYKVPGIFLIFDNITTDFNLFYRSECIKGNDSIENIINKLEIQLNKTTFNIKLKDYSINSIINDYYLYFITRNNSLESRTKDLSKLIKIFEEICNMKFNYQKKNEKDLNTKDFLELLIWSNIYNLELNEFLYCIQYFKEIKLFEKTNIYNEVLKTIKIYDKEQISIKVYNSLQHNFFLSFKLYMLGIISLAFFIYFGFCKHFSLKIVIKILINFLRTILSSI
jgi:hypothetical protein